MKQKYSFILFGFFLGIFCLGTSLFLLKRNMPLILKTVNKIEEQRWNNRLKAKEALVICDFEDISDFKKWQVNNASIEPSSEHVTSGRNSAKVIFSPSSEASLVKIEDFFKNNKNMTNWSRYELLNFDIFSPFEKDERIILQIKDKKDKRKKIDVYLKPNVNNHVEIEISELSGEINLTEVIQFNIFLWNNKKDKTFYLDNIRLMPEVASDKPNKNILSDEFIPKQGEKIYATGDYFAFNKSNWLRLDKEKNTDFIEFPLGIKNYLSVGATDLPFSGGIPFPQGELKSLDHLVLRDNQDNNLPFQAKIVSYWPDKSIKWILLTIKLNLSPGEEKRLFLRYNNNFNKSQIDSAITIEENNSEIIVNTGVLKFNIHKNGFYLFDNVWLDNNVDGKFDDNELMSSKVDLVLGHNGIDYYSHLDKNYELSWEEKGPIRACLKAKGWFVSEKGDKFCQFVIRISAFSGSSYLKVQHTFIYTGYPENKIHYLYEGKKMPKNETIDSVYLTLPLRLDAGSKFTFAADNKIMQGDFTETVDFLQNAYNSYGVAKNDHTLNSGNKLDGWIDLSSSDKGVCLGVKNFWEQFPKEILLDKNNNRMMIYLWPNKSKELDFKTTQESFGPDSIARGSAFGVAKTHDIYIYFHKSNYETSDVKNTIKTLLSDLLITADPKWNSETKVLGKVWPYDKRLASAEDCLNRLFDWGNRQIINLGWYGMVDFGDTLTWYRKEAFDKSYDEWGWHPEGRWGWYNCEAVGTHSGALLQFLRTNDYKYLIFGKNLARHIMDIDTCHYNTVANDLRLSSIFSDDYSQVGSMHKHCGNHWGDRNEETSHTNVYGLILYYYITGDERARDVIDEIGSFFLSERVTYIHRPDIAPQRSIANVLWGDVSLYELTQDERYKKAADKWANLFFQGQKYNGSWTEDYNPVRKRWDGKSDRLFMRDYTIPALIEYHKLTGNRAIGECIVKATDFVIKKEEYLGYFDASAYSYWLTGDKKYVENIKNRIAYTVKHQRKNTDPIWDGMILEKAYYMRVMDFLYKMPYAFEVITKEN